MDKYLEEILSYKSKPDSLAFLQSLYSYFLSENYDYNALVDVSAVTKIKASILKIYIYQYAEKYLDMSKDEFDKYRKEEIEKNKDLFIGIKNPILEEYGTNTKFLYNNEIEKKLLLNYIYKYSLKNKFSSWSTAKMSKKLNISEDRYISLLEEYAVNYLQEDFKYAKPSKPTVRTNAIRDNNTRLRNLYKTIIDYDESTDMNIIDNLIRNSGYNMASLRENFELYKDYFTSDEYRKFYSNLVKYNDFRLKKNKQKQIELKKEKKEEELRRYLDQARQIIISYLETKDKMFLEFLDEKNIDKETFNKYLESIKKYDKELYKEYLSKKDEVEEVYTKNFEEKVKIICDGVTIGIKENGKVRKFDIIDYELLTNVPFTKVLPILHNNKKYAKAYSILKNYRLSFQLMDRFVIDENKVIGDIMKDEKRVGIEFDKNGKYIEGSGRVVTEEEKRNIICYIKNNNIQLNSKTYAAAFNRYNKGFLKFNKDKTLTLENK